MQSKAATLFSIAVIALAICASRPSSAQQPATAKQTKVTDPVYQDTQRSPDEDIQLLKRDVRSQKKQIIAANMGLTDAEAEKFWPVYDRYATELSGIYDTKIALLSDYADNYKTMTGEEADNY